MALIGLFLHEKREFAKKKKKIKNSINNNQNNKYCYISN